jgi:predicted enzyme related to lactoylglutathione lyase
MRPTQDGEPTHWLVYFTVASCDDAIAAVTEGGGSLIAGPMETVVGKVAAVSDPQGAAFALFEGEVDP